MTQLFGLILHGLNHSWMRMTNEKWAIGSGYPIDVLFPVDILQDRAFALNEDQSFVCRRSCDRVEKKCLFAFQQEFIDFRDDISQTHLLPIVNT